MKVALALALVTATAHASSLRVLVVDASNKPCAGIPLSICSPLVPPKLVPMSAITRADGIAEFADVDRFFTDEARAQIPEIFLDIPLARQEGEPLLMREIPKEPLRIVLPPTKPVEVFLVGEELPGAIVQAEVSYRDSIMALTHVWKMEAIDTRGGRLTIPYMGAGVSALLRLHSDQEKDWGYATLPEITSANPSRWVECFSTYSMHGPALFGSAIDEDGSRLAHRELRFHFGPVADDAWVDASDATIVHTDAYGGFSVRVHDAELEAGVQGERVQTDEVAQLIEVRAGYRRAGDGVLVKAIVVRPRSFFRGSYLGSKSGSSAGNLNAVQLSSSAELAYGIVMPPEFYSHHGVSESYVELVERIVRGEAGSSAVEMRELVDSKLLCDACGSFDLRARPSPERGAEKHITSKRTCVLALAKGCIPDVGEIQLPATKPLLLTPRWSQRFRGQVLADLDIDPRILSVELRYRAHEPLHDWLATRTGTPGKPWPGSVTPDEAGNFGWSDLPPGPVDVRFRIAGSASVIYETTSAVERSAMDPNLTFDLRGKVK